MPREIVYANERNVYAKPQVASVRSLRQAIPLPAVDLALLLGEVPGAGQS